jgi:hypothetical protein
VTSYVQVNVQPIVKVWRCKPPNEIANDAFGDDDLRPVFRQLATKSGIFTRAGLSESRGEAVGEINQELLSVEIAGLTSSRRSDDYRDNSRGNAPFGRLFATSGCGRFLKCYVVR